MRLWRIAQPPVIAIAAFAAAGVVGVLVFTMARPIAAQAEVKRFTLHVRDGSVVMPDGVPMYVWGFTDDPAGGPKVPGPPIVVNEGDTVEVTLVNDRDPTASTLVPTGEGHTIHLHGLDTPTEHDGVPETHPPGLVRQGERYTYRFVASHAGTYFYHCHQNNVEHQQMGMYGAIVVRPAGGAMSAYTGGPVFDREETLVLAEAGVEGHDAARRAVVEGTDPYNWLRYRPDYFLMGSHWTADSADVVRTIPARQGERILVRLINAGYVAHAVHSHLGTGKVVATDGRPWPDGPTTDTIWLGPGEKYDVLFVGGITPRIELHDHVDRPYTGASAPAAGPPAVGSSPAMAQKRSVALYLREGTATMPDGTRIAGYGYTDDPTGGGKLPGPTLTANQGELLEVTLVNDGGPSPAGHSIEIPSLGAPVESTGPAARRTVGKTTFFAAAPGTYLYGDSGADYRRLGLFGALVVRPADGAKVAYPGGPTFDKDYTMVLSELDPALQEATRQAILESVPLPIRPYAPSYFLINGLAYPDTERDLASAVHADPGERILIRLINAGQIAHAMHLHGYHFDVVTRNGTPWANGPKKDTVLIGPGEIYTIIFLADQTGLFPFHDHFETANTNNGVWLGGMHTMVATGVPHQMTAGPSRTAPTDGLTVAIRDNYFTPTRLTVLVGSTVRWDHQGRVEHTVSSLIGAFDSGVLNGGDTFSFTFSVAGRYDYFCRFHITNRGSIFVE